MIFGAFGSILHPYFGKPLHSTEGDKIQVLLLVPVRTVCRILFITTFGPRDLNLADRCCSGTGRCESPRLRLSCGLRAPCWAAQRDPTRGVSLITGTGFAVCHGGLWLKKHRVARGLRGPYCSLLGTPGCQPYGGPSGPSDNPYNAQPGCPHCLPTASTPLYRVSHVHGSSPPPPPL